MEVGGESIEKEEINIRNRTQVYLHLRRRKMN